MKKFKRMIVHATVYVVCGGLAYLAWTWIGKALGFVPYVSLIEYMVSYCLGTMVSRFLIRKFDA